MLRSYLKSPLDSTDSTFQVISADCEHRFGHRFGQSTKPVLHARPGIGCAVMHEWKPHMLCMPNRLTSVPSLAMLQHASGCVQPCAPSIITACDSIMLAPDTSKLVVLLKLSVSSHSHTMHSPMVVHGSDAGRMQSASHWHVMAHLDV